MNLCGKVPCNTATITVPCLFSNQPHKFKSLYLIGIPSATLHRATHKDGTHNPGEERIFTGAHSYINVRHLVQTALTNQIYSSCRTNKRCALAQSV